MIRLMLRPRRSLALFAPTEVVCKSKTKCKKRITDGVVFEWSSIQKTEAYWQITRSFIRNSPTAAVALSVMIDHESKVVLGMLPHHFKKDISPTDYFKQDVPVRTSDDLLCLR